MNSPSILSYKPLKKSGEINSAYSEAIKNSGGYLQTIETEEDVDKLIDQADGVLLPGGADINPILYKEEKKEYTGAPNDQRDGIESYLIEKAVEKNIPILGICRGLQMLNVKFGGTLYQDIEKEMKDSIKHDYHDDGPRSLIAHDISFKEGSALSKIVGADKLSTNSLHHQGIKDLAPGFVATSFAPDGLVEAIEMPDHPYIMGVQWHPEELTSDPIWKKFFDRFIEACSKKLTS